MHTHTEPHRRVRGGVLVALVDVALQLRDLVRDGRDLVAEEANEVRDVLHLATGAGGRGPHARDALRSDTRSVRKLTAAVHAKEAQY